MKTGSAYGVLSHRVSAREARLVSRKLKSIGYGITIRECRTYVADVAAWCEPTNAGERRKLERILTTLLGLQPWIPLDD